MTPLEMIAEWRKGCSVSNPTGAKDFHPEDCPVCTVALIKALENALLPIEADAMAFREAVSMGINLYLSEDCFVTAGFPGFQGCREPREGDSRAATRKAIKGALANVDAGKR